MEDHENDVELAAAPSRDVAYATTSAVASGQETARASLPVVVRAPARSHPDEALCRGTSFNSTSDTSLPSTELVAPGDGLHSRRRRDEYESRGVFDAGCGSGQSSDTSPPPPRNRSTHQQAQHPVEELSRPHAAAAPATTPSFAKPPLDSYGLASMRSKR